MYVRPSGVPWRPTASHIFCVRTYLEDQLLKFNQIWHREPLLWSLDAHRVFKRFAKVYEASGQKPKID